MPQPPDYNPVHDYSDWQTANPGQPLPGPYIDEDYAAISVSINAINANLALIQRDDGALGNEIVDWDQLTPEVRAAITGDPLGLTLAGLSDTDITDPQDQEYLQFDAASGKWVNVNVAPGAPALNGLSDVTITAPTDNQVLSFDEALGEWVNASEAGLTRISSGDTTPGYLSSKLRIGGKGGTKINSGANEILELKAPWTRYAVQAPGDPDAGLDDDGQTLQVDCSAGQRTITLDPLSTPIPAGVVITFTKTDLTTNACIIAADAADQINGQAQIVLTAPYESVTIQSWGTTWAIVARGGPKPVEVQLRAGAWTPRPGTDGSGYPAQISSTPMNYTMLAFDYAASEFACFDWRPPKTFNPAMPVVADVECMVGSSAVNLGIAWKLYGESRAYPHVLSPTFSQTVGVGGDVNAVNQINEMRFPELDLSAVHAPGRHLMLVLEGDTASGVWTMTGDFAYVNALNVTYFEMQQTVVI